MSKPVIDAIIVAAIFIGIAILISGCSTTRALVHACRDGLCR